MVVTEATRSGVGGLGHRHCVGAVGSAIALTFGAAAEAARTATSARPRPAASRSVRASPTGSCFPERKTFRSPPPPAATLSKCRSGAGRRRTDFTSPRSEAGRAGNSSSPTGLRRRSIIRSTGGRCMGPGRCQPRRRCFPRMSRGGGGERRPALRPLRQPGLSSESRSDVRRLAERASYTGTLTLVVAPE